MRQTGLFDEQHPQAAPSRIPGDTGAVDAAAHYQQIKIPADVHLYSRKATLSPRKYSF